MTSLENILEPRCYDVEAELQPKLRGLLSGALIRGYLPQSWVFKTDKETVTFTVDRNGNASVRTGAGSRPDVTIDIDHEYLSTALSTRRQPSFPAKRSKVKFHTPKGKTAYNFLR